jgi:hypothetical protein
MNIWHVLGIANTRDTSEIRRAYARRLKLIDQREEREAFQQLREAYEIAIAFCAHQQVSAPDSVVQSPELSAVPSTKPHAPKEQQLSAELNGRAEPAQQTPPTELEAIVDQRELDWNRAHELIGDLRSALRSDQKPSAIDLFKKIVQSEELHSINLRDSLEWQLIFVLSNDEQIGIEFVVTAVDFFEWRNRPDLMQSGAGPALHALLRRADKQFLLDELRRIAASEGSNPLIGWPPPKRKAARALLSPFSRWRCTWQGLTRPTLLAVNSLLREIDERAPDLFETDLDARTIDWWRRKLNRPLWTFNNIRNGLIFAAIVWAVTLKPMLSTDVHPLALLLGFAVGTTLIQYALVWVLHSWRRSWGSKLALWGERIKERSLGRILPGAVNRGLGWRHLGIAIVCSPIATAIEQDNWSKHDQLLRMRFPYFTIMLLMITMVFAAYAVRFELWHRLAPAAKSPWQAARHSGYFTVALVGLVAILAAAFDHAGPLVAASVIVFFKVLTRKRNR